jgi:DNA-binding Lrp family transcriptional regulator
MKYDLDSIISVLHKVESNNTNEEIVFTHRVNYGGKHYSIEDKKEFDRIYANILFTHDYGLANVRILQKGLVIAIDRITPKGSRFLKKARILKAINQEFSSETAIAEALELKQHTVNYYLEQLDNEGFIVGAKGYPIVDAGELEYQSCVLKPKGKQALEDPNYLVEESNMTEHRTIKTDTYYEQSGNIGIGHMSGGEIKDNAKVAGVINKAEQQNLAEAAAEIQALLEQLSETYPTTTSKEKNIVIGEAVEQIENNPTLKSKVINALKAGGKEAFKEAIDHPLVNILMATIEGWQEQ